jgi:valyl-tRNA synthetase
MMDYEKAKFTLDNSVKEQVKHAFIKLYEDGLIEKGVKLINLDTKLESVISDIEIESKDKIGKLYFIKYRIFESEENLLVATSRPETIFADAALFINPEDGRYRGYVGREVLNPITGNKIPILSDKYVKIDFGTGVLKCTPAHDFNDYDLGKKYNLPIVSCCDEKGNLNDLSGK